MARLILAAIPLSLLVSFIHVSNAVAELPLFETVASAPSLVNRSTGPVFRELSHARATELNNAHVEAAFFVGPQLEQEQQVELICLRVLVQPRRSLLLLVLT